MSSGPPDKAAEVMAEGMAMLSQGAAQYDSEAKRWGEMAKGYEAMGERELADACTRAQLGCTAAGDAARYLVRFILAKLTGAGTPPAEA